MRCFASNNALMSSNHRLLQLSTSTLAKDEAKLENRKFGSTLTVATAVVDGGYFKLVECTTKYYKGLTKSHVQNEILPE